MTEWILTKDRKPEKNKVVLITYVSGSGRRYTLTGVLTPDDNFYIHALRDSVDDCYVPAWRPVPKPYKDSSVLLTQTPCDLCVYDPPSSGDGKPCSMCPAKGG